MPTHGHAQRLDVDAEHGKGGAVFAQTRCFGLAGLVGRGRQHQPADLLGLVGEVVLHHHPAQVLQHRQQVHHFGVVASRAQHLGNPPGQADLRHQCLERVGLRRIHRPRPGAQALCRPAHAVQPQHRQAAANGQHRAVARHATAPGCAVDQAQQLKTQRDVLQHHLGQLCRALMLHRRQAGGPSRRPGHGRQHADAAQTVQQQGHRATALLSVGAPPAFERANQGAGVAVALAFLPVGGAVDDRAQGFGNGLHAGPRQTHDLAAQRWQALQRQRHIRLFQRRHTRQGMVHDQAKGQHVVGGGVAQRLQVNRVRRFVRRKRRPQPDQAGVVHFLGVTRQQHPGLQVVVHAASIVGKGQPLKPLHRPGHQLGHRHALRSQPLGQAQRLATVIGDVGPQPHLTQLQHLRQGRVVEAAGAARLLLPALQGLSVGRLVARHRQHQRFAGLRIGRQPGHAAAALAHQLDELEAAKHAQGVAGLGAGLDGHAPI